MRRRLLDVTLVPEREREQPPELAAAVVDAGYVLFVYPPYRVEMSMLLFAVATVAGFALLYVAAMFVHIYMGTIGVEGAFEAMADGTVDVNWAKERHRLWYEEETQPGATQGQAMRPAE